MIAGHFPCYSCEFAFGDAYGLALLELADVSGGDNYIVFPGIADYPETVNLFVGHSERSLDNLVADMCVAVIKAEMGMRETSTVVVLPSVFRTFLTVGRKALTPCATK